MEAAQRNTVFRHVHGTNKTFNKLPIITHSNVIHTNKKHSQKITSTDMYRCDTVYRHNLFLHNTTDLINKAAASMQ
jgi:hypothetical protein